MFVEKQFPFFIQADLPMAQRLILDIADRRRYLRSSNTERAITFLPFKAAAPGCSCIHSDEPAFTN